MEHGEHREWRGNTGGTSWMHRMLIRMLKHMNLRFVYLGMAVFVVPFYMLLAHQGYIAMFHYFRRRHGFGVWRSFRYVYLNHYRFGQIILDRFAAYAGRHFEFQLEGNDAFLELCHGQTGMVVLSCHVGNYELAGYTFQSSAKRYNALVYSGEAKVVMEQRGKMLSHNNIRMIPVSADMSHVFLASEALADGEIVSIPADRINGSTRYVTCDFLGCRARFPLGPFVMAVQRGVPIVVIFVMKESASRYKCYIHRVEAGAGGSHKERVASLAQNFAREMETVLRQYPEQWFNYYEFWSHDGDKS